MTCSEKLNVYRVIICASVHAPVHAWVPACAGAPADVLVSMCVAFAPAFVRTYLYIQCQHHRGNTFCLVCISLMIRPILQV